MQEATTLTLNITATDPDGAIPSLSTTLPLPTNASFTDHLNGTGTLAFNPDFTQAGSYNIKFYATDGAATDSQTITITVTNTNRPPVIAPIGNRSVAQGANLSFTVSASDPDGTIPTLTTTLPLPANATFTDHLNGTGTFSFTPDFTQLGVFNVTFHASDGTLSDSQVVAITVSATNRPPVIAAIGNQTVAEASTLSFTVTATDPDGTIPTLSTTLPLPTVPMPSSPTLIGFT